MCFCAETGLLVLTVSLAVGFLLLLVLAVGGLMCYVKKRRPLKRYKEQFSFFQPLFSMYVKPCKPSFVNWRSRLYFFTDASSLPQDSPTHCFGRAVHEAALVWRPHTSASLYLWSLQPLKSVNLWPLLLPDHILEHWSPAGQLRRWVPPPDCPGTESVNMSYILTINELKRCYWKSKPA